MKVKYLSNLGVEESEVLFDFDCGVILKDRVYLRKYIFDLKIKKMVFFISI